MSVAPRVGAWIETRMINLATTKWTSHPVWVRGLKHLAKSAAKSNTPVAPRVGAWIETSTTRDSLIVVSRTPCGCVD